MKGDFFFFFKSNELKIDANLVVHMHHIQWGAGFSKLKVERLDGVALLHALLGDHECGMFRAAPDSP